MNSYIKLINILKKKYKSSHAFIYSIENLNIDLILKEFNHRLWCSTQIKSKKSFHSNPFKEKDIQDIITLAYYFVDYELDNHEISSAEGNTLYDKLAIIKRKLIKKEQWSFEKASQLILETQIERLSEKYNSTKTK